MTLQIASEVEGPVTVFARHAVRRGSEDPFERWIAGIVDACKQFEGYMGTEVIRPVHGAANEFVSIFRFDTYENLERWMQSSERERWLSRTSEFSDEAVQLAYHSLEFWFSPEEHHGRAPSKYKMALVTFAVIWPLVHFIPRAVAGAMPSPPLLAEAASVATIVLLMTYLVMPTATRLLSRWLFN